MGSDGDCASEPPTRARRVALGVALASSAAARRPPRSLARPCARRRRSDWSSPASAWSRTSPRDYASGPRSGLCTRRSAAGVGEPAKAGDVAVFQDAPTPRERIVIYGTIDCGIGCGERRPQRVQARTGRATSRASTNCSPGCAPGEKRRALIPPAAGYVSKGLEPQPPEFGQKRQVEVRVGALVFEVKLVKTRQRP